jgi:energy-coupling factor transport system ATP-binding protein
VIRFDRVSITYPDRDEPTLRDVELTIDEGELCVVVGRTGVGKSTLLGCINGLVPHFSGGNLRGSVSVDGRRTSDQPPREFAELVGVVGQDPLAGFVTDTVEEELAYGMEQLGVDPAAMRKRVEETLDLLGIAELRNRALRDLSGGQQQRVAIGSVLTAHPRVLVLDEPTSALDPTAAEEVLAAITRLVHDLGITVVMAEHRLERVAQYADSVVELLGDGSVRHGRTTDVLATAEIAPPVVQLGRLAGWSPLPMSVRDARRCAEPLRARLAALEPNERTGVTAAAPAEPPALRAEQVVVSYGSTVAVRQVDLELHPGRIVALMGRNGCGKSSLLWALQGSGRRSSGRVQVPRRPDGTTAAGTVDTTELSSGQARRHVGLVPQTPSDLLYLTSVALECTQADHDADAPAGTCDALLDALVPGVDRGAHPRDLSEGQRLALVLAIQLCAQPPVVLLDEPTRGLDYLAKERLAGVLRRLADEGRAIVVATHDVEFVAICADRVVVMAEGEVVADGPAAQVVAASPAFAPQVAKVLSPQSWLHVEQVRTALAGVAP